jgi:cyclophilin family peptidyl-prolyl cis-trans isomerase
MVTLLAGVLACGVLAMSEAGRPARGKPAPKELRAPTAAEIAAAKKAGKVRLVMETDKGTMTLELAGTAAPAAVANFINLANARFYEGIPFHRVEPRFVIQAGDPTLAGRPTVSYTIPDEKSPIKHTRGTIAMARLYGPQGMIPNSASTQFYICLADAPHLDQLGFTAFGRVVKGIEVIDKIAVGDKLKAVKLAKRG